MRWISFLFKKSLIRIRDKCLRKFRDEDKIDDKDDDII